MQNKIDVKKPNFSDEFIALVKSAKYKGAIIWSGDVEDIKTGINRFIVKVVCNKRTVGRFYFMKEKNTYKLTEKMVIESEFNPFELAIYEMVLRLKSTKIKSIVL